MDLRSLPSVDALAKSSGLSGFPERVRITAARRAIEMARQASGSDVNALALQIAQEMISPSLTPILNASGVILHTGAGRARLAPAAAAAIQAIALGHSNLELDLQTGKRGDRQAHVRSLLCELTGAEDAFVVNNNAAAVILTLRALANRGEVILSRGEMVEIGGSFRMPEIVRQSGCKLVEVGTTNKTHLRDYREAVTERTRVILKCHPSNFTISGFVATVPASDLTAWDGVLVVNDLGSGCLIDLARFGLPHEQTLAEAVAEGAHIVTASGDKLLGGPQCGIILGSKAALDKIKKNPLARALRCDKLTLAALEATLRLYTQGLELEVPTIKYMARTLDDLRKPAEEIAGTHGEVLPGETEVGGGSLPGAKLPTWCAVFATKNPNAKADELRTGSPKILARTVKGAVWIDPRTLDADEVSLVAKRVSEVFS